MNSILSNPEGYHAANDHPQWNQSIYFNLYDPFCKIGCFIRIGIYENLKESNNWFIFFKDGKPLYTRLNMALPYTSDRMDKGLEVDGIRIKAIDPLKCAHIKYSSKEFSVDLTWDGLHPMEDSVTMTRKGNAEAPKEMISLHMEGGCRVKGLVTVRGETPIEINGMGFRDVAVGPRNWEVLQHYRLAWPVFLNGMTFAGAHGILTSGHDVYTRMFYDGTQWLAVKEIEDNNTYETDTMTIKSMHWKFKDSLERSWEFTAKPLFRWFFPFDNVVLAEHMMEYRLGDGTVGYGLGECGYRLPSEGIGS